ncbi:MAG: TRAP transporter substrate-binding protein [Alysiella sp.]|uniref:TRAP transporter substrate-binding protein n=1 Tax=Alysiella sp. TaxID=1872483 RepID=UPI0026DD0F23|nr:TRAP transporter substrate-binding protein [Alysiella sp.]MDO4433956.1 TRAP transporter substrate-binding protein [Alysiella sp.]
MQTKILLTAVFAALSLAACSDKSANQTGGASQSATSAAGEKIVLKIAHPWPATAMVQKQILEPWCEKLGVDSNQALSCQFYPAMQLGGTPQQLIDQVQDGVADIVWTLPGYTPGRFPSMEVMEIPFLTQGASNSSRVAWKMYQEFGQKDFEAVKPLSFNVHDRGHIHNNVRPITQLSDIRGLKLRAPTRLTNKMVEALGGIPVSVPMPGLADAVSKGVVDGYILPWEIVPTLKLHEMTKYHSEINSPELYSALFVVAMNKQRYESLPENLRQVIDKHSGEEFAASIGKAWDESVQAAREQAVKRGNAINEITGEQLAEIQKVAGKVESDWIAEMKTKGYDGEAMVKRARELVAQGK